MKYRATFRLIACLLAVVMCLTGLPLTAQVFAAPSEFEVEPSFMLDSDTHHYVEEIPIGQAFAISTYWTGWDPESVHLLSLVSEDGKTEYVLYDNGAVNYSGYIASADEGAGWMRGFLSAGFRPGKYYTRVVTDTDDGMSEITVEFVRDETYVTPPVLTTRDLPDAKEGVAYSFTLQAQPAYDGKITWSIASGNFPAGLKLDQNTGKITGTPTTSGFYMFNVTIEEENGGSQTDQLFLNVAGDIKYFVSFRLNGGTGATGVNYDPREVKEGTSVTLPAGPKKTGCAFVGWEDDGETYPAGASVTVNRRMQFLAVFVDREPMKVTLPKGFAATVGSVWLEGEDSNGRTDTLWRGYSETSELPVISVRPGALFFRTFEKLTLYGYVNNEKTALASYTGTVNEETESAALKDAGVKREILYGVSVAGLTEKEDYTVGNVTWENGGDSGWLGSFPCMVAPGNVYHLSLWGKHESSRYADYNWQDRYTVNEVTEGWLKVVPVSLSADAVVTGVVTKDGQPMEYAYVSATQSGGGIMRSVHTYTEEDGSYALRLLPGAETTFFVSGGGEMPHIYEGETLASPADGAVHDIKTRTVLLTLTVTPKSVSDTAVVCRYLTTLSGYHIRLRLDGFENYSEPFWVSPRDLSGTGSVTRTLNAGFVTANVTQQVTLGDPWSENSWIGSTEETAQYKDGRGAVTLSPELNNGVVVPLRSVTTGHYFLAWYDAKGAYIGKTYTFSLNAKERDVSAMCPGGAAGDYTVVLFSEAYHSDAILENTALDKLAKGQEITRWSVSLKKTEIKVLSAYEIDGVTGENALYVTKPHTTLNPSAKGFSGTSEMIVFSGTIGLDPGLSDGKLHVLHIETDRNGPTMIPAALTVNGRTFPLSGRDAGYTVDFDKLAKEGVGNGPIPLPCSIALYAKPFRTDKDMWLNIRADVTFTGGRWNGQPVGEVTVQRPGSTVETRSTYVCGDKVALNGVALANETVSVYDNDHLIGRGRAENNGRWRGEFTLYGTDPQITTAHEIRAVTASGVKSPSLYLVHRANGPELKDLIMYMGSRAVSAGEGYTIGMGYTIHDVSFKAVFKNANMLQVMSCWDCKVVIKAYLGNGEIKYIKTKENKDGTFSGALGDITSYVAATEALYQPAPDISICTPSEDGVAAFRTKDEYLEWFSPLNDLLVQGVDYGVKNKAAWFGLTAKNDFSVTFKNGKAAMTGSVNGTIGDMTDETMKKGLEEAAQKLATEKLTLNNLNVRFRNKENVLTWLNEAAASAAASAKSSVFLRNNLFTNEKGYQNAKNAVEQFAVNPEYNENASSDNHVRLQAGEGRTFDIYSITDMKRDEDGRIASGTYQIMAVYGVDTTQGAPVYSSATVMMAGGDFKGYKGVKKTESVLDELNRHIYVFHNGKFTEDKAYELDSAMGADAGTLSYLAARGAELVEKGGAATGWLKHSGVALGIVGLGSGILSLVQGERDTRHRSGIRIDTRHDMDNLMDSPCYKRLSDEDKAKCDQAYQRYINAYERYESIDDIFAPVNFFFNESSVLLSIGGLVPYYGKLAGKVANGMTIAGYNHACAGAIVLKDAQDEMIRAYEDSFREIGDIFQSNADKNDLPDCKMIQIDTKIIYHPHFDPAGIVYEGVIENPVQGAEVTLWYGVDANGALVTEDNAKTVKKVIPAADVTEKTPVETVQVTGADGRYQWFVPEGLWFVTASYGGLTGNSDADTAATVKIAQTKVDGKTVSNLLPVLPVQLDVNIPLVDKTAPAVEAVRWTEEGVYVTFSKYMVDTAKGADSVLNPANYALKGVSGPVAISKVTPVEQGHTPANIDGKNTKTYTRTVLLTPKTAPKKGDELLLTVKKGVKSYAGSAMAGDHRESGTVTAVKALGAPVIAGGAKQTVKYGDAVTISLPKGAPADARICYTTDGSVPTANSNVYTDGVAVTDNVTLKAVAVCPGYPDSAVATAAFTVAEAQSFTLAGDALADRGDPAGLTVKLTGTGYEKTATVGADGSYLFRGVPVGSYTLSFAGSDEFNAAEAKVEVTSFDPWVNLTLVNKTAAYTPGDVDGDGKISSADARLALRRSVNLETFPEGSAQYLACDADGDGKVSSADARLILRASVGLEDASQWKRAA